MKTRIIKAVSTVVLLFVFALGTSARPTGPSTGTGIGNDNGGPKQSWQDIYKNPNLRPQFPSYDIEGRSIGYHKLCLAGERIRTRYKYVVTINYTKFIYDYLYTDRVRMVEQCVRWREGQCIAHELVRVEIPFKQPIQVLKRSHSSDSSPNPGDNITSWTPAFEKDFELNECPEEPKFPN